MGTPDGQIANALSAKLEAFRKSDEDRNALLDDLVREYHALGVRYAEKCDDYENEVSSRRHWQNNFSTVKRDLDSLRDRNECYPFALALIDGDGAMFHEHLLRASDDGGSEAGHLLMAEIKKHLQDRHGAGRNWSVMVQVYANFEGLSRKLAQIGVLKSPAELHTFARSFSCNQPLFSFIDVGSGKERADHKMREMLRLFMFNSQCKHIIFGGCHDNGYLTNLEPLKRDETITSRMTLLETTPAERGFVNLGMNMVGFPSVFRSDPLPDTRPFLERHTIGPLVTSSGPAYPQQPLTINNGSGPSYTSPQTNSLARSIPPTTQTYEQQVPTPTTTPGSNPANNLPNPIAQNGSENGQPPLTRVATVSPAISTSKPSTYATVGRTDGSTKQISIAAEKKAPSKNKKAVYLNTYDERIDLKLQKPEAAAVNSLHQRIKTKKVCNNFHLLDYCSAGRNCGYSHEPKLSQKEQLALKVKARDRPCGIGSACRDVDCLSGHHCPRGDDCGFAECIFGNDSHYIERAIKLKYFEDGEVEIVH